MASELLWLWWPEDRNKIEKEITVTSLILYQMSFCLFRYWDLLRFSWICPFYLGKITYQILKYNGKWQRFVNIEWAKLVFRQRLSDFGWQELLSSINFFVYLLLVLSHDRQAPVYVLQIQATCSACCLFHLFMVYGNVTKKISNWDVLAILWGPSSPCNVYIWHH